MNKPKSIGTAAETAVVKYARAHGFPGAERLALTGAHDQGDVRLANGIILEVKAHKQFSDNDIRDWMAETRREMLNANASHGTLVVKRPGKGDAQVGAWWAIHPHREMPDAPVIMLLADCLELYRLHGHGDPL